MLRPSFFLVASLTLLLNGCSQGTSVADGGPLSGGADAAVPGGTDAGAGDAGGVDLAPDLPPAPGRQVLLYTGAGGGGPGTDLSVSAVRTAYTAAGITAETADTLPGDFAARIGVLMMMNPRSMIGEDVKRAAKALVARGGRLVVIMEHCKNGCWGNESEDNLFLAAIGSTIRLSGMGGAPLAETQLTLMPTPPLTDAISSLIVYYSGSVTAGPALGRMSGGDTIIAYEKVGLGDVVAVADSSMFGYVLSRGDNTKFVTNLGRPLR